MGNLFQTIIDDKAFGYNKDLSEPIPNINVSSYESERSIPRTAFTTLDTRKIDKIFSKKNKFMRRGSISITKNHMKKKN